MENVVWMVTSNERTPVIQYKLAWFFNGLHGWLLLILYILNQILHTMWASLSAKRTEQICTEQVLCVLFLWFSTVHFLYVCGVSSNSDPLTLLAIGGQPSRRKLIHFINANRQNSEKHIINEKIDKCSSVRQHGQGSSWLFVT